MNPNNDSPTFSHLMLAADLEHGSETLWAHALRLCLNARGRLSIVHATSLTNLHAWSDLPTPRQLLESWGVVRNVSALSDFENLGIRVHLHAINAVDPRARLPWLVDLDDPDLLILGTHRPVGLHRLLYGSVGETLARNAPHAALVVPDGVKPLVDTDTGVASVRRILVPIGDGTHHQQAVDAAVRLARTASDLQTEIVLMRVGDLHPLEHLTLPVDPELRWRRVVHASGSPLPHILQTAEACNVDAIAMVTQGHDSVGDVMFGSITDHVLRASTCPVLVVPRHR